VVDGSHGSARSDDGDIRNRPARRVALDGGNDLGADAARVA
jgi:hypothetical protein